MDVAGIIINKSFKGKEQELLKSLDFGIQNFKLVGEVESEAVFQKHYFGEQCYDILCMETATLILVNKDMLRAEYQYVTDSNIEVSTFIIAETATIVCYFAHCRGTNLLREINQVDSDLIYNVGVPLGIERFLEAEGNSYYVRELVEKQMENILGCSIDDIEEGYDFLRFISSKDETTN